MAYRGTALDIMWGYQLESLGITELQDALSRKNTLVFDRPEDITQDIWDRAVAELMWECPAPPGLYDDVVSDNRYGVGI